MIQCSPDVQSYIFRGNRLKFSNNILSLKIDFLLANGANPDEMSHFTLVFTVSPFLERKTLLCSIVAMHIEHFEGFFPAVFCYMEDSFLRQIFEESCDML